MQKMKKPKISVIGLGFVGLTLAVINAKEGFDTLGIDIDKTKLNQLNRGETYFFEPQLQNFLKNAQKNKKIHFTSDFDEVIKTDITFLTVGTPSSSDGKIDLNQLKKVVSRLSKILKKKKSRHLLVVKSTVIPSTTSKYIEPAFKKLKNVGVVVNPEFLREGQALQDLLFPHIIVIGANNITDGKALEKYYKLFYGKLPEVIQTNTTTAEMIKYTNNVFLATKISFINSIANICQNIPQVDVKKIAYAIGKDSRIGPQFLNAGPGFGGSCLPKDLSALIEFSNQFGKANSLFKAVKQVNDLQPYHIIDFLKNMGVYKKNKTVSILGIAFKNNTDDIREAVSVKLVKILLKKGIKIKAHDPMALKNLEKIFGNKLQYCKSIKNCLINSNCCVILTDWKEYKKLVPKIFSTNMKESNIVDARRILESSKFTKLNFTAVGLGPNIKN